MPELICSTKRKARKEHKCNYCRLVIEKGDEYNDCVLKEDGEIYKWKSHRLCDSIVDYFRHNGYMDNDELTSAEFEEAVWQYANNNDIRTDKDMEFKELIKEIGLDMWAKDFVK